MNHRSNRNQTVEAVPGLRECKRSGEVLRLQRDLAVTLSTISDLDHALKTLLAAAVRIKGFDCGGVYAVEPQTGALVLRTHLGLPKSVVSLLARHEADSSRTRFVQSQTAPVYTRYRAVKKKFGEPYPPLRGLKAMVILPIRYEGRLVAVMNLASRTVDDIPAESRLLLESVIAQAGGAIARMAAEAALVQNRKNLQALFDAMEDMLFVIDGGGLILHTNQAVQKRLGFTLDELRGHSVLSLHPPERRREAARTLKAILEGKASVCNVPVLDDKNQLLPVETRIARGAWNGLSVYIGITRDFSDRKQVEDALRESEERYRMITENAHDLISLVRPDTMTYLYRNEAGIRTLGYSHEELLGQCVYSYVHPDELKRVREDLKKVWKRGGEGFEFRYRRKDGSYLWLETNGRLLKDRNGLPMLLLVSRDITERRHRHLLEVQEKEQRRLGQELHDGLCQQLAGVSMLASFLKNQLLGQKLSGLAAKAAEIERLLEESVAQAHNMARGLLPVPADPTGLASALEELADTLSRRFHVHCGLDCPKPVVMEDAVKATHLYRIVQEAAGNAIRHGKATQIQIKLHQNSRVTALSIADNGVGIQKKLRISAGLGLHVMEYRAREIGASFDIRNQPEGGVAVTCRFLSPRRNPKAVSS